MTSYLLASAEDELPANDVVAPPPAKRDGAASSTNDPGLDLLPAPVVRMRASAVRNWEKKKLTARLVEGQLELLPVVLDEPPGEVSPFLSEQEELG